MRIFALETNVDRLKRQFLSAEEQEIAMINHHPLQFVFRSLRHLLVTVVLVALGVFFTSVGLPAGIVIWTFLGIWILFVAFPLLRAYIDWKFDFVLITTDKVVIVDQSSLFHRKVTPMNLENFASVSTETQFLNLFPFGVLHVSLKEGTGIEVRLRYIPQADDVAAILSDAVTQFQRRKDLRRYGDDDGVSDA
jgi:hypothetical protein